jgi:hypothetical protein
VLGQGDQCPSRDGECTSRLRRPEIVPGIDASPVEIRGLDYHVRALLERLGDVLRQQPRRLVLGHLPKEPWQRAHVLEGVIADAIYVGGVHVCAVRSGIATCRGNDWAGAVRGAR